MPTRKKAVMISSQFTFHAVGQGLFYSGLLNAGKSRYAMVYDCGSDSSSKYLHNEIAAYKTRIDGILDLLIISHFHDDHINGISKLLDGLTACKHVILPYLYPTERLLIYLSQIHEKGRVSDTFISFVTDPVSFLTQFNNVDRITFIRGDGNAGPGMSESILTIDPSGEPNNQENFFFDQDNSELDSNKYLIDELTDNAELLHYQSLANLTFEICLDNFRVKIRDVWELYFFNQKIEGHKIDEFKQKLVQKYPDWANGVTLKKDDVEAEINELKAIYETTFGKTKQNLTSLVVYHAPYRGYQTITRGISRNHQTYYWHHRFLHVAPPETYRFGSLLTGDIGLRGLNLPPYITSNFANLLFLQIPHHGSSTDWDFSIINRIPGEPVYSVINFGLGNKYRHPSEKVINDIAANGRWHIIKNTQIEAFGYHIELGS